MTEMFRYMPLLQSRIGEFEALRNLDNRQRSLIQPVITIAPPKWDFKNDQPSCSVSEHVGRVALKFRTHWGPLHDIRVDGFLLDTPDLAGNESHPMERMMEIANTHAIRMIPVTGLGPSASYQRLTKEGASIPDEAPRSELRKRTCWTPRN